MTTYVVDNELGRLSQNLEIGPAAEGVRGGPVGGVLQRSAPHVEAENVNMFENREDISKFSL